VPNNPSRRNVDKNDVAVPIAYPDGYPFATPFSTYDLRAGSAG
jgi:hypothetical protein